MHANFSTVIKQAKESKDLIIRDQILNRPTITLIISSMYMLTLNLALQIAFILFFVPLCDISRRIKRGFLKYNLIGMDPSGFEFLCV